MILSHRSWTICLKTFPQRRLSPVPSAPPLRRRPCRRADRLLRGGRHPESRPRGPALLGRALHQRHPGQRHRVFSGCTLKCCFCQNYPISAEGLGKEITIEHLAEIFLGLQEQGAHNINLVTPASGGLGSSRRWTSPGPRGCVCPSSATPAATRRWRAWRRGAALSISGWPI